MYMTQEEQYLFDLRGYMVLPGVLSEAEVEQINQVIDRILPDWEKTANAKHIFAGMDQDIIQSLNAEPGEHRGMSSGLLLDWGEPIRRLVGHEKVLPYLIDIIGSTLRLDHEFAVLMKAGTSADALHGGNTPHIEGEYYHFRNNRIYSGLTVASFALTDAPPGAGGFCVVPGSHKSNLPLPREHEQLTSHQDFVRHVPVRKGDVVIFTEALTHGVLPWKRSVQRRTLIFKYSPGFIQWEKGSPFVSMDHEDWQEYQRYLLSPPYREDRPKIPWPPKNSAGQA